MGDDFKVLWCDVNGCGITANIKCKCGGEFIVNDGEIDTCDGCGRKIKIKVDIKVIEIENKIIKKVNKNE